jgi:hypothetical protein
MDEYQYTHLDKNKMYKSYDVIYMLEIEIIKKKVELIRLHQKIRRDLENLKKSTII